MKNLSLEEIETRLRNLKRKESEIDKDSSQAPELEKIHKEIETLSIQLNGKKPEYLSF